LKFRDDLKHLRRNLYGSITDSIIEVVRYLHLDTELELRDGGGRGRLHLNKFLDEAAKFSRTGGSLFDFLSWIKIAESEEGGLKPAAAEVDSSVIQILTVHSAKGLEWDIVSIPGLVEKKFPDAGKKTPQWTKHIGVIPSQMRRDSSLFNHFEWPAEKTSANVRKALEDFDEYWKSRRELEEYRLAYVAFTRAKSLLLLTSALFYGSSETPSEESRFSHFARAIILQSPENKIIFEVGEGEHSNPATDNPDKATWPLKREINSIRKEQSIALTRAGELSENEIKVLTSKAGSSELDLLVLDAIALLNDKKSQSTFLEVVMPPRLSVSALISLSTNKEAFALNVRRPLPIEIDPFAKRGTVFHTWLENHFQRAQLITDEELELIERVPDEDFKLAELKEKWLASEYANKEPFLVEMPFDLSFNGVVLRGRIDAIYRNGDEYEVVDWKTGRSKSGRDAELVAIQLATYRLAFSRLHKVPLSKISAKFFYVGEGLTVQPNTLMDEDQLHSILTGN
jgi:DNA helicase-2/ATP-dependent DNA helicase PcrA